MRRADKGAVLQQNRFREIILIDRAGVCIAQRLQHMPDIYESEIPLHIQRGTMEILRREVIQRAEFRIIRAEITLGVLGKRFKIRAVHRRKQAFIRVGADDHRHLTDPPAEKSVIRILLQHIAVDNRAEGERAGRRFGRREDRLRRQRAHRLYIRAAQLLLQRGAVRFRVLQRTGAGARAAALQNRAAVQTARQRRRKQHSYAHCAGRLPVDRDAVRVTAERADIALDPAQRGNLIEQSVISARPVRILRGERRVRKKAERAETIVDGDEDLALLDKRHALIQRLIAQTALKAAAVHPEMHRQVLPRRLSRRPDI